MMNAKYVERMICFITMLMMVHQTMSAQDRPIQDVFRLYDYRQDVPLELEKTLIREDCDIRLYSLSFLSPVEGCVTGYLIMPQTEGLFPGLIFGHWGLGTSTEFLPEALIHGKAGTVCLLIDYPWVRPARWRRPIDQYSEPEKDREIFIQAVVDLRRSVDVLDSLSSVDMGRIGYVGHSYGAQWGAILSAVEKRIKAVVLVGGAPSQRSILMDNPDPDFVALRDGLKPGVLEKYINIIGVLDGIRYVPHAAPTPLFFQFAKYERYFDESDMVSYAEAASQPKTIAWYDAGHELNGVETLMDRASWLQNTLGLPIIMDKGKEIYDAK